MVLWRLLLYYVYLHGQDSISSADEEHCGAVEPADPIGHPRCITS